VKTIRAYSKKYLFDFWALEKYIHLMTLPFKDDATYGAYPKLVPIKSHNFSFTEGKALLFPGKNIKCAFILGTQKRKLL
jgi:hypothetical protein